MLLKTFHYFPSPDKLSHDYFLLPIQLISVNGNIECQSNGWCPCLTVNLVESINGSVCSMSCTRSNSHLQKGKIQNQNGNTMCYQHRTNGSAFKVHNSFMYKIVSFERLSSIPHNEDLFIWFSWAMPNVHCMVNVAVEACNTCNKLHVFQSVRGLGQHHYPMPQQP